MEELDFKSQLLLRAWALNHSIINIGHNLFIIIFGQAGGMPVSPFSSQVWNPHLTAVEV